jgi:uncharacterized membrane-anchored protein
MKSLRSVFVLLFSAFSVLSTNLVVAQEADSSAVTEEAIVAILDSIDKSIDYKTGEVVVGDMVKLAVPGGYKFIPADKANMIITDLWGNPKRDDILGMVVKADYKPSEGSAWAFIVTYDESGYVKDEDADDIDYDDLKKDIQKDELEVNKTRKEAGYDEVHFIDWAAKPFYDKDKKILHWAKKIQFGATPENAGDLTLNYEVRILGRKGVLSLNAVGTMSQLAEINQHVPDVLAIAKFTDGNKYSDFDPSIDKVAAYTIGGLIAGKLIAKTGILVLLLKNIKLIALGLIALFGAFRKRIGGWFSRKKDDDNLTPAPAVIEPPVEGVPGTNNESQPNS